MLKRGATWQDVVLAFLDGSKGGQNARAHERHLRGSGAWSDGWINEVRHF